MRRVLYIVALMALIVSCGGSETSSSSTSVAAGASLSTMTVTITNSEGLASAVTAEIANTPAMRALGLMYRESLAVDAGMIFIFDDETENPFWMKNTSISLDIIFIDADKRIVSIAADTVPYSEDLLSASGSYLYTLEVNAGYCAEHGVQAGDVVAF